MDSDLQEHLDSLSSNITALESALHPLLSQPLSSSTSKLPLLDKAKLYVLSTYALESILFSSLRLNGVEVADHPIKAELNRVKEYFSKIKSAEEVGAGGRSLGAGRLEKEAAGRFIKHGLAGNEKYDRERKERTERERAGAKRKLEAMNANSGPGTHTRFDAAGKKMSEGEKVAVVSAKEADDETGDEIVVAQAPKKKQKQKNGQSGGETEDEIVVAQPRKTRGSGSGDTPALDSLDQVLVGNGQESTAKKGRNKKKSKKRQSKGGD